MLEQKLRKRIRAKAHLCHQEGLRTPKTRAGTGEMKWTWAVQKPSSQELGPLRLVQGLAMVST